MTMKHYRTDGIVVSMHNKGSLMTNPSHEAHVQALMTKPLMTKPLMTKPS